MSINKRITRRILPTLIRTLLPAKYFDEIFIGDFLKHVDLRMLSLTKTIKSFKLGVLPFEYLWFDLDHNDYRNYLPTRNNYKHRRINGNYNAILANKLLFEIHLKSVIAGIDKLHVVDSLGFIEKGFIHSLSNEIVSGKIDSLIGLLNKSDLILKQISGDGGVGLECFSYKDGNYFIDNKSVSQQSLMDHLNQLDNYLIQRRIVQKGFAGEIYSGSVNTMRIGTMIEPGSGRPFIAFAVHRFGSPQSGFVDNVGQGGITAKIDIGDGRLSMAHYYTKKGHRENFECHPVSSATIYNRQIPYWDALKQRILEMAGRMPYLKYVGWDFVLSGDDLYVMEGNVSPGLGLVQLYNPMSDYPEAWNFFKYHGYLD